MKKPYSMTLRLCLTVAGMTQLEELHHRFSDYSLVFKGHTQRTIRWYKDIMAWFLKFTNIKTLEGFTEKAIEDWIFHGKIEKNWSPKTIKNCLQALSSFGDWLVRSKYLKENPVKNIPRPKLPKRIPRHLTKEEATKLLDWTMHFPYDYRFERTRATAIIAMFAFTGIRLQELKNLKVHDVDLESRTLFVKSGKGEKDRIIPLNPRLITFLQEYLRDRDRLKKTCPYFFTAMREDSKMGDKVISRLVKRLRKKSGIYFYPHLLRHTFATLMLEGGCNIFALSKMMGHSDIKTTTIYLSATATHLQEQITKHPLNDF